MRINWSHLEQFRRSPEGYESKTGDTFGWFVWQKGKTQIRVMAVDGDETGWEHVSVSVAYKTSRKWEERTPKWDEMRWIKSMFWEAEECVVEFHPPESDYVNLATNCLHLWRYVNGFPMPPKICV